MLTYTIEVHSMGYEDHKLAVQVESKAEAKLYRKRAVQQWAELNDIDYSTNKTLPSVTVHDGK